MNPPLTEIHGMQVIASYGVLYAIPSQGDPCDCEKCKSLIPRNNKPMQVTIITEADRLSALQGKYL